VGGDKEAEPVVAGVTRFRHYLCGVPLGRGGEGKVRKGLASLRGIKNWGLMSAAAAMICFAVTTPAYAYLDPGTGSLILQAVIGVIAGALVALRIYWDRVKSFIKRKNSRDGRSNRFVDRK